MESSKKHSFSDQILSSRRRVLTRFGLGVGVSLTAFTVLFLTNSINGPFVSPMFKGINDAVGFSFSSSFNGSSTSVEQGKEKEKVEGANMSFPLPYQDLVNTQLRNSSQVSNITVVETKQNETQQVKNVPSIVVVVSKNETSFASDEISVDLEKTNFGNSTTQDLKTSNGGFDESCDIYDGKWVRDDSKPLYPAGSCPYIDKDFDCHLNGRLDDEFLKWKWQPNGCDIPSLNGTDFLERLRGKKLVFVGDSLNRNMWESLVCILRHSVKNKERVFEISGKTKFKKKGFYAFRFEDYNCTVDFVGSPFLVQESTYKSQNGSFETLRLDLMDKSTSMYHDADIIVFNTGHWWTHEKTSKGEDYYQEGDYVHHQLKVLEAYKRALTTWARWVDKNIDSTRTLVIFRGYSVTHFRGGPWNLGGQCHNETEPFLDTKYLRKYPSKMRALGNILHDMRTPVVYMNISRLTDFRKDGHPSIYRLVYKTSEEREVALKHQDCSHWCLPGVPDTWNELLYVSVLMAEKRKN